MLSLISFSQESGETLPKTVQVRANAAVKDDL